MTEPRRVVAGVDVGTECVKALILEEGVGIIGRSVVPTRGYFQHRVKEALDGALDEAQIDRTDVRITAATGFGTDRVPDAAVIIGDSSSHALGAFHHFPQAMSVIDIGGQDPKVLQVDGTGRLVESRFSRKCAVGIGTFLMFTARHLDVHPTRLQELASEADTAASIGSYCSIFAGSEVLERLLEGVSREDIALGCMRSVAERIYEIGGFQDPVKVTGGVAEYFPGVLKSLSEITGLTIEAVPEPIMTGALGAALKAQEALT